MHHDIIAVLEPSMFRSIRLVLRGVQSSVISSHKHEMLVFNACVKSHNEFAGSILSEVALCRSMKLLKL